MSGKLIDKDGLDTAWDIIKDRYDVPIEYIEGNTTSADIYPGKMYIDLTSGDMSCNITFTGEYNDNINSLYLVNKWRIMFTYRSGFSISCATAPIYFSDYSYYQMEEGKVYVIEIEGNSAVAQTNMPVLYAHITPFSVQVAPEVEDYAFTKTIQFNGVIGQSSETFNLRKIIGIGDTITSGGTTHTIQEGDHFAIKGIAMTKNTSGTPNFDSTNHPYITLVSSSRNKDTYGNSYDGSSIGEYNWTNSEVQFFNLYDENYDTKGGYAYAIYQHVNQSQRTDSRMPDDTKTFRSLNVSYTDYTYPGQNSNYIPTGDWEAHIGEKYYTAPNTKSEYFWLMLHNFTGGNGNFNITIDVHVAVLKKQVQ